MSFDVSLSERYDKRTEEHFLRRWSTSHDFEIFFFYEKTRM